jgi:tRNA-2-methylthio-N6-dimethylallyladenosine synthase
MVGEVEGISRIRFVTSHPRDFSDRLIEEMAVNPKVCEYLHLPAQAGSDKILELMNRGYTRDQYLSLVQRIRKAVPDIALTADFIVGFPGESEDDFQQTLDLVREARYHNIYSFRYSSRPGTAAEKMKPEVPSEERAERLSTLQGLQDNITERIMKGYEGTLKEVLLEGPSKTDPGRTTGRTRCNIPVHVPGVLSPGKLVTVRIIRALRHSLEGEVVS